MASRSIKKQYIFTFYIIVSILFIIMCCVGYILLRKWDFLNIEKISIIGNQNLESLFLEQQVEEFKGINLFKVSKNDAKVKFDNIIRIKKVQVNRRLPKTLQIKITERVGKFLIKTKDNKFKILDKDLCILDNNNFYENEIFPIISTDIHSDSLAEGATLDNKFVNNIINIHNKIEAMDSNTANEISEYYEKNGDIYMVNSVTKNTIVLPDENFTEQLNKYLYLKDNNLIDNNIMLNIKHENQIFEEEDN